MSTHLLKREIIAASRLVTFPGHWLLTGKTQGESGTWYVIRKPNGTCWTAVMLTGTEESDAVVEIGDKVVDTNAVRQFESGFVSLSQAPMHSRGVERPQEIPADKAS